MKTSIYKKIRRQISTLIVMTAILFAAIIIAEFYITRQTVILSNNQLGESANAKAKQILIEHSEAELQSIVGYKAALSDNYFNTIETDLRRMVYAAEAMIKHPNLSEHEALENLRQVLLLNILDSIKSSGGGGFYYVTESGNSYYEDTLGLKIPTNTNMTSRPWYTAAKAAGKLIWSDLFDDAYGRGLSITCAMPFYYPDGRLAGVAGAGMAITGVIELVVESIGETGRAFMINENGQIIIAENMQKDENGNPIRENLLENPDESVRRVAERMQRRESGIERVTLDGVERFVAFHGLESMPWCLAIVIDVDEIISPAHLIESSIFEMKQSAINTVNRDRLFIALITSIMLILVFTGITYRSNRLAKAITMPILKMTDDAGIIAEGNIDHTMKINTDDELEVLANSFNTMIAKIKTMTFEKITAEAVANAIKENITYASKIQRDLLPSDSIFKDAFDDYCIIWEPRDIVSGDIYWVKKFASGTVLCIADCTGHGVSGALLTMLVMSALQEIVTPYVCDDTAGIIYQIDKRLALALNAYNTAQIEFELNDGCDIAVLFIATDGRVTVSSAGINVFISDKTEVKRYKGKGATVGEGKLNDKNEIETISIPYNPETKIFMTSDGLTDQTNTETKKLGYRTIEQIILENHTEPLSAISNKIWDAFLNHQGDQVRLDDVELIGIKPGVRA